MKTKEEVIKEAWGSIYEDVKERLNEHGQIHADNVNFNVFEKVMLMCLYDSNTELLTNKGLQGIENNNGWVKIESEKDFPKENGVYHVYYIDGVISSRYYDPRYNDWNNEPKATHYQPIIKRQPPLY